MKVRMLKGGDVLTVNASYGTRLIAHGRALAVKQGKGTSPAKGAHARKQAEKEGRAAWP